MQIWQLLYILEINLLALYFSAVVAKALPAGKKMPAKTFFDVRLKFLENLSSQKLPLFNFSELVKRKINIF